MRETSQRYMVIAGDSHAGPSLQQLRAYCPSGFLDAYDDFVRGYEYNLIPLQRMYQPEYYEISRLCPGLQDPQARLRDMDADGIVADVIFAGGMNGEPMPWESAGYTELRFVGQRAYNDWLVDFCSVAPHRLRGVMEVPIWDIDAAVAEVERGSAAGLGAVNFPASRADRPAYNDPVYDPFWSAVAASGLPLVNHVAGGDTPHGVTGPGGTAIGLNEVHWLARRSLWQMIFGRVLERHPTLKVVFTEQRVTWVPVELREMDSINDSAEHPGLERLPRRPSEYWASNFYVCASFMAPFEVALRHQIGLGNMVWGTDYPHVEGTWPRTRLALRYAFAGVPRAEARQLLGENAISIYGLDRPKLRALADRIGPTEHELETPLDPTEYPEHLGLAFRKVAAFS